MTVRTGFGYRLYQRWAVHSLTGSLASESVSSSVSEKEKTPMVLVGVVNDGSRSVWWSLSSTAARTF